MSYPTSQWMDIHIDTYILGLIAFARHSDDGLCLILPHVPGGGSVERHLPFMCFRSGMETGMEDEVQALLSELKLPNKPTEAELKKLGAVRFNRDEYALDHGATSQPNLTHFGDVVRLKDIFAHQRSKPGLNPDCLKKDPKGAVAGRFRIQFGQLSVYHRVHDRNEDNEKFLLPQKFVAPGAEGQPVESEHQQYLADAVLLRQRIEVPATENPYVNFHFRKFYQEAPSGGMKIHARKKDGRYLVEMVIANMDAYSDEKPLKWAHDFDAFYQLCSPRPKHRYLPFPAEEIKAQAAEEPNLPRLLEIMGGPLPTPSFPSKPRKCPELSFLES